MSKETLEQLAPQGSATPQKSESDPWRLERLDVHPIVGCLTTPAISAAIISSDVAELMRLRPLARNSPCPPALFVGHLP